MRRALVVGQLGRARVGGERSLGQQRGRVSALPLLVVLGQIGRLHFLAMRHRSFWVLLDVLASQMPSERPTPRLQLSIGESRQFVLV